MSGQSSDTTILQRLAQRLSAPVSDVDRDRALLHVMDWAGCVLAGAATDTGKAFLSLPVHDESARAFRWGALGNILEMDDVDKRAILHCGPIIIPAALAGADDGQPVLDAIVRGYEATIRLGRAAGRGHYAIWHSTATCGPIGAAVAAASLRHADTDELARAMSLAMSQATGLWQTRHEPRSAGKQLHVAHAARAGLDAARLAAAGLTGPLTILEGQQGFFAATCPDGDPEDVLADYGGGWLMHQVSFKPWPACRHTHAAIDAARLARGEFAFGPIEIVTYPDALTFCDRPEPQAVIEAKFSIQHAVAAAIIEEELRLEHFEPCAIKAYADLRKLVTVSMGEPYASAYPAHYGAELRSAGKVYSVRDARGDPENPVTEKEMIDKTLMLLGAAGITGRQDSNAFLSAIRTVRDTGNLRDFLERLP